MPRAVQYERWGDPSVLDVVEVAEVHPGVDRVRVAVRAVGLNPFDSWMRSGKIPLPDPRFPRGVGIDVAGIVDEVGEGARYADGEPVRVGDEVFGWGDRTVREQVVLPAANLARKPAAVPWVVAGALATAAKTAHTAVELLAVGEGDVVLEGAAAGAVGFLSSQLATLRGAAVLGTASAGNHELLASAGIIPVLYGDGLAERVRAAAPGPVTAVQDNHGRETVLAGQELGVDPTRITSIADGEAAGELGVVPFPRSTATAQTLRWFADRIAEGVIRLPVDSTYPLADVRAAFARLEGRHLSGKVAIALP